MMSHIIFKVPQVGNLLVSKKLGYMFTNDLRGHVSGVSQALCILRDSNDVTAQAMAYMCILNTVTMECGLLVNDFLMLYPNDTDIPPFFRKRLEHIALYYGSMQKNVIYRLF